MRTLNHTHRRSLVVTKRWRFDIDALPTHASSLLSHCASASGRLQHTTKRARSSSSSIAFSSSIPGCTVAPAAHRAKMLNGARPSSAPASKAPVCSSFNVNDGASSAPSSAGRSWQTSTPRWTGSRRAAKCLRQRCWRPDGLRFVSGSNDNTARIAYHGHAESVEKRWLIYSPRLQPPHSAAPSATAAHAASPPRRPPRRRRPCSGAAGCHLAQTSPARCATTASTASPPRRAAR